MTEENEAQAPVSETIGSLCWLAMDAAWMWQWKVVATALVVPSILAHLWLFRRGGLNPISICVTASLNCWLCMNASWLIADLWNRPALMIVAKVCSALAAVLVVVAFVTNHGRLKATSRVLRGFRRIR